MDENNNDLLLLGLSILGMGLLLAGYSISAYLEVKHLNEKIDFETLANSTDMSVSDKYYEYLSIDDFLEHKLTKNKNIPIKNISCVYLDYAQQNAIDLYNLTNKKLDSSDSRRNVTTGIIRKLYNTLEDYKTCKQYESYKKELKEIGFRWASNKKAWYWHSEAFRKRSKRKLSMNDIRNYYGSTEVQTEHELYIEA